MARRIMNGNKMTPKRPVKPSQRPVKPSSINFGIVTEEYQHLMNIGCSPEANADPDWQLPGHYPIGESYFDLASQQCVCCWEG